MILLRIFFAGLIAFVQQPKALKVVLVDSSNPPDISACGSAVSVCKFHTHEPMISIKPENLAKDADCPETADTPGVCQWSAQGLKLTFSFSGGLQYATGRGFFKSSLPSGTNVRDFSWVPSMKDLDSIAAASVVTTFPMAAGTATFDGGRIQVCHLGDLQISGHETVEPSCSSSGTSVNAFRFETIDGKVRNNLSQTLADSVMVRLNVTLPYTLTVGEKVIVLQNANMRDCVDGEVMVHCVDVAITNMPPHIEECPGIGTDFALLYSISGHPASPCMRLVPHRTATCVAEPPALKECDSDLVTALNQGLANTSPDSRPVCPMVIYGG